MTHLLLDGLTTGAIYALVAAGLGLVFGVLGFVNLAHGEVVAVSVFATIVSYQTIASSFVVAACVGIAAGALFGIVLYHLALRFAVARSHFVHIVFTLAIVLFMQSLYLVVLGPEDRTDQLGMTSVVDIGGNRIAQSRIIAGIAGIVVLLALAFVIKRSAFGRSVRAVAANRFGAVVAGISLNGTAWRTFLLGAVLAATAGALSAPFTPATAHLGLDLTLRAFVIVILAGAGTIGWILVAGMAIGLVESAGLTYLPQAIAPTLVYLVIIPVLLFLPKGLSRGTEALA